jgi:hypothetical protein
LITVILIIKSLSIPARSKTSHWHLLGCVEEDLIREAGFHTLYMFRALCNNMFSGFCSLPALRTFLVLLTLNVEKGKKAATLNLFSLCPSALVPGHSGPPYVEFNPWQPHSISVVLEGLGTLSELWTGCAASNCLLFSFCY